MPSRALAWAGAVGWTRLPRPTQYTGPLLALAVVKSFDYTACSTMVAAESCLCWQPWMQHCNELDYRMQSPSKLSNLHAIYGVENQVSALSLSQHDDVPIKPTRCASCCRNRRASRHRRSNIECPTCSAVQDLAGPVSDDLSARRQSKQLIVHGLERETNLRSRPQRCQARAAIAPVYPFPFIVTPVASKACLKCSHTIVSSAS